MARAALDWGVRELAEIAQVATQTITRLDVSFQEVVHSDRTEETGVTKLQHSSEGPNEHPQECPSHAAASRGDRAVGYGRRFFQSPCGAGVWCVGEDRGALGRAL